MWFAAILPPLLLWIYIWRHDAQPEPTGQLLKAVLFGVGIIIPVALLENVIEFFLLGEGATTLLGTTIDAFFVAALPEESFKLLALWLVLRRNRYFDEHYDGIVYAVCIGLGFAAVENIFYVFADDNWAGVAILRALLAVPGHYAFAVMMGYYYSLYHFVDRSPQTAACVSAAPYEFARADMVILKSEFIVFSSPVTGLQIYMLIKPCKSYSLFYLIWLVSSSMGNDDLEHRIR